MRKIWFTFLSVCFATWLVASPGHFFQWLIGMQSAYTYPHHGLPSHMCYQSDGISMFRLEGFRQRRARSASVERSTSSQQLHSTPSQVHVDLVGLLPASSESHMYHLTTIERSTRWVEAISLRNMEAKHAHWRLSSPTGLHILALSKPTAAPNSPLHAVCMELYLHLVGHPALVDLLNI